MLAQQTEDHNPTLGSLQEKTTKTGDLSAEELEQLLTRIQDSNQEGEGLRADELDMLVSQIAIDQNESNTPGDLDVAKI